mmetsp:Transcript_6440/g.13122  ORF Transcript_6440/g.13122 Transcript_6440/m.13122 type:complete len:143 (-) Transcript_6440:31-459(-)|eukprot:CAMPEP_0119475208 /NCGR_PEP_ID=MMETSP1344-20130328/6178_1 /TAXON_ID=236787 /ORGANISM="Florenciella parvula, Strain CCMP2471" /LENGTH=142 /DNA_ID=CAMNT_0007508671 /DNA_START=299 /DNA_END=727 /DNA_ORIENTATION=+
MIGENQKIGVMLFALGMGFLFFGVIMFFDTTLLTIGNVLFLAGVGFIKGPAATINFFQTRLQGGGARGVVLFFGGILLVLFKWPVVGMALEGYGFVALWGNILQPAIATARQMPVLGNILALPGISQLADKLSGQKRSRYGV